MVRITVLRLTPDLVEMRVTDGQHTAASFA